MKHVIALLLDAGWLADGQTDCETVRIPTTKSPVSCGGRAGGEIRTFGGRMRFRLPQSNWKVTVGRRTVVFYRVLDGKPKFDGLGGNFKTTAVDDIRALVEKVHRAAEAKEE